MISFSRVWRTKEVRQSILFVLGLFLVYRFAAHVPVPGVDTSALSSFFQNNQLFGLLNVFSGGTMENFSIVAMGVAPYITASIIFQLLAMMWPKLEEMQKEEQGRQRINQWTRLLTVPLAGLQAYGLILLLRQQAGIILDQGIWPMILAVIILTAGTVFMMWLGELISEKHVGNGISLMIFAGIIAGLPSFLQQSLAIYDRQQIITFILFIIALILTIIGVVLVNEAQRNIPVKYARQINAARFSSGVLTHLPLRVNMAGVMPIIFAISLILTPTVFAQFFVEARTEWVRMIATKTIEIFANQWIYGIIYFLLVFGFSYFYTAVIFHPDRIAENLQKQGGFIPGIRPGAPTAQYLHWVSSRILFFGGFFLALIAVLPLIVQYFTANPNMVIGGTSLLIIVAVIIESIKQVEGQISMHEYDG
ncbi:preprotein translocase subunit SecY [Candidatus Uhrbacteria bacterium CG_4_9_14_3_um_filter_36_7]|uniref:Protein translocase subunit SecY n=1 Tax=Candidatus Uhrbacteria bacterium CG_4_9_14_3_um_filter_36_7 TaxID=1975033 RepID=A0A2M7XHB2_9BACT|nr:MAG: preprotein translocase subunit SecY [Candidatus Uhrbacteria bacterium CG_4_9_14_3_um_filter_36_7]